VDDVAISLCSACQSVVIASVSAAIPQHRSPLSFGVAASPEAPRNIQTCPGVCRGPAWLAMSRIRVEVARSPPKVDDVAISLCRVPAVRGIAL
jgi:hypothetical protein